MHKLHVKIENLDSYESQDLVSVSAAYFSTYCQRELFDHYLASVPDEVDRILNESLGDRQDENAPSFFEITIQPLDEAEYGVSAKERSIDSCPECHGAAKAEFQALWKESLPPTRYELICELVSTAVSDVIATLANDVSLKWDDLPSHVKPWVSADVYQLLPPSKDYRDNF